MFPVGQKKEGQYGCDIELVKIDLIDIIKATEDNDGDNETLLKVTYIISKPLSSCNLRANQADASHLIQMFPIP